MILEQLWRIITLSGNNDLRQGTKMTKTINYNGIETTVKRTDDETYIKKGIVSKSGYYKIWTSEDGTTFIKAWKEQFAEIQRCMPSTKVLHFYDIVKA